MPRKQKVVQDLDIVEIQDGVEVGSAEPNEPIMEENNYQFNDPDPNVKAQAKQAELRRREAKKEAKYGTLTDKRLAALAKGREIARINREKKKQEFEEKIKLEMKQEMEQLLKSQARPAEPRGSAEQRDRRSAPEGKVSPRPKGEKSNKHEVRPKEKQQVVEQQDSEEGNELPQQKVKVKKHDVRPKEVEAPGGKEFQPVRVITKQKFQEEAKKIVESSKKKMPIFKDDEKKASKVKGRVVDFFKPHKVVYVSDSEEEPSE